MKTRSIHFASLLAAAALAAGCGGGGNDLAAPQAADPLREVPASASQSIDGLMNYLASLLPLNADALEPVSLDSFAPRTSEDAQPQAVGG